MTDREDGSDSSQPSAVSFTRRTVLKVAGLAAVLSDTFGSVGTAQATDGEEATQSGISTDNLAAERITSVDDSLGQHTEAVALDGTTALLGVPPTSESTGPDIGRAVILSQSGSTWRQEAILSPDGDSGQFGRAVALAGDTAVIGGELGPDPTGDHAGSATVFIREQATWRRHATLSSPAPEGIDLFGTAVDAADDVVLVGSSAATTQGSRSGAAFVFTRAGDTWRQTARLLPQSEEITEFGRAVATDGDTAVVGARRTGTGPRDSGVAFVFGRRGGTWYKQAELEPVDRDGDNGFGSVVTISEGTVVAGAPTETNALGTNAGAAYVYARRNKEWYRQAILHAENEAVNYQFGTTIAIDGETALIGTEFGDGPFVFVRSGETWTQMTSLGADDSERGTMMALDDAQAFVGAEAGPDHRKDSVEVFGL